MEKLNATKHYLHYPKGNFPAYLAYGFRPIFLVLVPYLVLNLSLWAMFWAGAVELSFLNDPITWHIYELLFGVGTAGVMAFLFTGLPELFPGVVPIVGKRLAIIVAVWLLGRLSFWFLDFISIYLVAFLNLTPFIYTIFYAFKPVVLDKSQKHSSIAYNVVILTILQACFFASQMGFLNIGTKEILNLSLGAFMCLILLALRRINIEAINERLEDKGVDDVLLIKPPRYNLAIFSVALFTIIEFFFPQNTTLGWLGLAASSAILGTLSEYKMDDSFILFEPYVIYLGSINLMQALGYGFMGFSILYGDFGDIASFKHFLTTGAFGLAFFMVLIIVSYVHTGRHLKATWLVSLGVLLIIASTILRVMASFYPIISTKLYIISSFLWVGAFVLYYIKFYPFLLTKRADGLKG